MTTTDPYIPPVSAPATPPGKPPDPRPAAVPRALLRWGDTAVGAAVAAEEATADMITALRRAAARRGQEAARLADRSGQEATRLADRGAVARARWQHLAGRAAEAAVTTVATSPLIDRIVDAQLQRVLRPVVLAVLDDVLQLLEQEPERIRPLIRGQRETMADELVDRLRAGAEAGDTVVDRLTLRMFHRGPRTYPTEL